MTHLLLHLPIRRPSDVATAAPRRSRGLSAHGTEYLWIQRTLHFRLQVPLVRLVHRRHSLDSDVPATSDNGGHASVYGGRGQGQVHMPTHAGRQGDVYSTDAADDVLLHSLKVLPFYDGLESPGVRPRRVFDRDRYATCCPHQRYESRVNTTSASNLKPPCTAQLAATPIASPAPPPRTAIQHFEALVLAL